MGQFYPDYEAEDSSLRVCPNCRKAFYMTPGDFAPPCPHCGYVLIEQRGHERVKSSASISFVFAHKMRSGLVLDLSQSGLRVAYAGDFLPADEVVEVDVGELGIHGKARAVWTAELGDSIAQSGLMFIQPLEG